MAAFHSTHRRFIVSRRSIIIFLYFQIIARSAQSFLIFARDAPTALRLAAASTGDDQFSSNIPTLIIHHAALKTRNITTAIQFYSLLDYQVTCRFRAGPARAAWLELAASSSSSSSWQSSPKTNGATSARLEIIEVPSYMLNEAEGTRRRAMDLMQRQDLLGYNHVALDVTAQIQSDSTMNSLQDWLENLNKKSVSLFGKTLRVALKPRQQIIGRGVYELAFFYDADGCLVELLHKQSELPQDLESGWEPWDGKGFIGENEGDNKSSLDE